MAYFRQHYLAEFTEDARKLPLDRLRLPDVLYTDNGSDFTSQHLEQVGADLKIRLVFSTLGKPRGCGRIERFFSTVNEMFTPRTSETAS